jgi:uncharacterized membrane protein YobD (UPF0266 family)
MNENITYRFNGIVVDNEEFNKQKVWAEKYNLIEELSLCENEFVLITKNNARDFTISKETWTDKAFKETKKETVNNVKEELSKEIDNIKPNHYRKGEIDLIESWYLRYPFNEFKTGMVMYADRYFNRNKNNRVEDMEKGLYVMQRLKEYEIKELEKEND